MGTSNHSFNPVGKLFCVCFEYDSIYQSANEARRFVLNGIVVKVGPVNDG